MISTKIRKQVTDSSMQVLIPQCHYTTVADVRDSNDLTHIRILNGTDECALRRRERTRLFSLNRFHHYREDCRVALGKLDFMPFLRLLWSQINFWATFNVCFIYIFSNIWWFNKMMAGEIKNWFQFSRRAKQGKCIILLFEVTFIAVLKSWMLPTMGIPQTVRLEIFNITGFA